MRSSDEDAPRPERSLPLRQRRAFVEDVGHFWGLLETRPYMRARHGLAQCLWHLGDRVKAIDHLRELLRLNPNDNQGVRYQLAACLLEAGEDDALDVLLARYADDASAAWVWSAALLEFRRSGDATASRKALREAVRQNPHVPAYLLGKKKLPQHLPDYIGFGDEREAIAYVAEHGDAWRGTARALDWLAAGRASPSSCARGSVALPSGQSPARAKRPRR